MLREIVLDTETTGLNPKDGDRLIEVGGIELIDRRPTGIEFHRFINPAGRQVHPDAERIHGISADFLADKPLFSDVVDEFLDFIGDATLVIHNAPFDVGFLNMELARIDRSLISFDRVVDTLPLAKKKHPAGPNSLDALCKRYGVNNSERTKHGAIVDSLLLAEVYVELLGIRQSALSFDALDQRGRGAIGQQPTGTAQYSAKQRPDRLPPRLSDADAAAHIAFVETLGAGSLWWAYLAPPKSEAAEQL